MRDLQDLNDLTMQRESSLLTTYWFNHRDDLSGLALRRGSLNSLFQAAFHLPPSCRGTSLIRKRPPPLGPPQDHRHRSTIESQEKVVSDERGTPVGGTLHLPSSSGRDVSIGSWMGPPQGERAPRVGPIIL